MKTGGRRKCTWGLAGTSSTWRLGSVACLTVLAAIMSTAAIAQSRVATEAETALLRKAMETRLKDAESALFREVRVGAPSAAGLSMVCGQVNAKNSYGAYPGFTDFIASLVSGKDSSMGKPVAIVIGIDDERTGAARKMCAENGL